MNGLPARMACRRLATMVHRLWFEAALLPDGWANHVAIDIADGTIVAIAAGAPPGANCYHVALPPLPNLHSHAFQFGFAGLAEHHRGNDSFWSWRDQMYHMVERLSPEDVVAIAAMAYACMLESGCGRVGEFHYLHHQPDGSPYANPARMAESIAEAARLTGIGLTLLPVFYAHSDFGGVPPTSGQRRFIHDLDGFHRLLDHSHSAIKGLPGAVLGVAPHSLRAVRRAELHELVQMLPEAPIHIHIAEQMREVEASLAFSGTRPVEWLFDHIALDKRWCLVHATHVTSDELSAIARSAATVGLCPITEANLGDGIFPAAAFVQMGGHFGVGSDSNVRIDLSEELRLLEYGQRLTLQRRNVLALPESSVGGSLFRAALDGGARALGVAAPALAAGSPADIVSLKAEPLPLTGDQHVDRWVFTSGTSAIDHVWCNGRHIVRDGRHVARDAITKAYRQTMARLHSAAQ